MNFTYEFAYGFVDVFQLPCIEHGQDHLVVLFCMQMFGNGSNPFMQTHSCMIAKSRFPTFLHMM